MELYQLLLVVPGIFDRVWRQHLDRVPTSTLTSVVAGARA
jgi:hypothetical protein